MSSLCFIATAAKDIAIVTPSLKRKRKLKVFPAFWATWAHNEKEREGGRERGIIKSNKKLREMKVYFAFCEHNKICIYFLMNELFFPRLLFLLLFHISPPYIFFKFFLAKKTNFLLHLPFKNSFCCFSLRHGIT